MALVLPHLSDAPSVASSHTDQVAHFQSQGHGRDVAEALYMALRMQDKGQLQQAVMYYTAILRSEPECQVAKKNLEMLITLNRPEVHQVLTTALEEEEAARVAAEAEEARRVAAEAAADEQRRQQEAAARAAEERLQAAAQEEQARRQAAAAAAAAEQLRRAIQRAEKQRRVQESYDFVIAKQQEKEHRKQNLQKELRNQFPGMSLENICINDVQHGNGGLICRSTHNSNGIGNGWNGHLYTSASSGRVHDSRERAPQPCYNCGEYHFRRDCPWGR
mmetsp:Transcript_70692/g.199601  ORF Transcript_70692/g.199601 Transcript_70692/m.199601 type:complete len:276 (-) Transcript_70692:289-1116(-)|eukprot:CAMPEP_0179277694 /NCGR_PEP_ID=MMETSP0797-20121207/35226_1 /TAXON_ID=47934 /ORGANISM="Dinophysis acuminata, Strain DAEP01" /LENGTH=275 /DNA_ID=CAMNT_0020986291 /DNA_START=18 /DNA_END=845 /DNA_ORIENTATION=-